MNEKTALEVADLVLSKFKPILEDIAKRLPGEGELKAIDAGIASALTQGAENGQKLEQLDKTMRHFADNFAMLTEEVRSYHTNTIDQYNKLGARVLALEELRLDQQDALGKRVHDLEEWRKRVESGETTLAEAGGK